MEVAGEKPVDPETARIIGQIAPLDSNADVVVEKGAAARANLKKMEKRRA